MTPLREERILARMLFQNQPEETQRFLQQQAASIAKALLEFKSGLNFALPEDRTGEYRPVEVPAAKRCGAFGQVSAERSSVRFPAAAFPS